MQSPSQRKIDTRPRRGGYATVRVESRLLHNCKVPVCSSAGSSGRVDDRQKAKGRRQKAEGRRQKAEGRRHKAGRHKEELPSLGYNKRLFGLVNTQE
jgi:hypothetical protein